MRKIDKSVTLSIVYKQWEERLEASASKHPNYTSSNFRYFEDIKMNLFHCQDGLCAYTEKRLCPEGYGSENWENGRYASNIPDSIGHLEHFDESLKTNKAWLWDNLFMVLEKVNVQKSNEPINNILKQKRDSKVSLWNYISSVNNYLLINFSSLTIISSFSFNIRSYNAIFSS